MANLATKMSTEDRRSITIHAPLLHMTKDDIIRKGIELGVDYGMTRTCYDPLPQGLGCRSCDACILRLKGFQEVGIPDPIAYAAV